MISSYSFVFPRVFWVYVLVMLAGGGSSGFAQTAKTVTLSGFVIDDLGTAIPGATVYYNNSPKYQRDASGHAYPIEPRVSSFVQTGKDGSFSLAGLPPSIYWLCAAGPNPTHLRSCDWGRPTTAVDVTSSSAATGIKLQIINGVLLSFQVTDAKGQINDFVDTPGKGSVRGNFRIFAVRGSYFKAAKLMSVSGSVRQYAIAVPKSATLRPSLDTTLNVVDSLGAGLASRAAGSAIAVSDQPATVSFTVR
jgi:hypothetical protein